MPVTHYIYFIYYKVSDPSPTIGKLIMSAVDFDMHEYYAADYRNPGPQVSSLVPYNCT